MEYIIGIGEYKIINNPEDVIKTFALSSCIGIVFYCQRNNLMAMVHIALPDSNIDLAGAKKLPGKYADTAIDFLYNYFCIKNMIKKNELQISIFGGAVSAQKDFFKIGERNIEAVKKHLKSKGLSIMYEDIGGRVSRTLVAYANTGSIEVIKGNLQSQDKICDFGSGNYERKFL
jgi:chemotaxis protein CheD